MLSSPVSSLDSTTAKVTSINTLSDSIVFVEIEVIPNRDFEKLPNGISPQTLMFVGNESYQLNNVAQVMPGSMFPIQNSDGYQGWHDAKMGNAYYLILTFIAPTISSAESISILPSCSDANQAYYSFPDIKLASQPNAPKAFSTEIVKSAKLYASPSTKSKKLLKLPKGEKVCIIEETQTGVSAESETSKTKNSPTKFCHAIVPSSGITGYVEENKIGSDRVPVELLTDAIKLSKQGSDSDRNSETAQIEIHNTTLTPVTVAICGATIEIDPLKTSTFRVRIKKDRGVESENDFQYFVANSEGFPPMIFRCDLTLGDFYHWDFVRANSFW